MTRTRPKARGSDGLEEGKNEQRPMHKTILNVSQTSIFRLSRGKSLGRCNQCVLRHFVLEVSSSDQKTKHEITKSQVKSRSGYICSPPAFPVANGAHSNLRLGAAIT